MRAAPHRRAAALRWTAVLVGTALLVTAVLVGRPPAGGWAAGSSDGERGAGAAQAVLARAAASSGVPFTGTATSSGGLGLPDLPRLGEVASLAGETTRTRTWWHDEGTWRTDVLTSTGESGLYAADGALTAWDYERDALTVGAPVAGARLPRAADLLPPALARSLLAGPSADAGSRAEVLGARVVAGRTADGVRLRPPAADARRTTLDHADLWVDRASGLPLAVDVVDVVGGPVLSSAFDALHLGEPDPAALDAPAPPGASVRTADPDLAAAAAQYAPWLLPDSLAGLAAAVDPRSSGVVAYGTGLVRIVAVPLPARQGRQALRAAEATGAVPLSPSPGAGADAGLVRAGALTAVIVISREHAYLLSGAVDPSVLSQAAAQLVADPPGRRA